MLREIRGKHFFAGVLCTATLALFLCATAKGTQSVTLGWNSSPSPSVAGFYLYFGTESGTYSTRVNEGTNTQVTIDGLQEGLTYYFALTAYTAAGIESAPAPEITYVVPGILAVDPATSPGNPLNIQFPVAPGHWYEIQASEDLKSWATIWQTATVTSNSWLGYQDWQSGLYPMRFYRLVSHATSTIVQHPILPTATQIGSSVVVTWNATVGEAYQVQYAASPNSTVWNDLGGVVAASSSVETMPFAVPTGSQWSYRVVLADPFPPTIIQAVSQTYYGSITFSWNTVPGLMYQVQYSPSLTHPAWRNLGGVINASSTTASASDDIGPDPQRYYRAVEVGTLPPPIVHSVTQANGQILISWNSAPGQSYQVQYSPDLNYPYWYNLGPAITAVGSITSTSDAIGPDPQRFYRVVLQASTPAPVIQSFTQNDGMITFSWSSSPGQLYLIQYTTSLDQPEWYNLTVAVAFDYTTTAYDLPGDPQRFYRVVLWQ